MTTTTYGGSAKIYEFPLRPRMLNDARRINARNAAELEAMRHPVIEYGSGWYHDTAIQESERPGKR